MAIEEERRAAAARDQDDRIISDDDLHEPPQPATATGIDPGGGQPATDVMTIQQLMSFLAQQNQVMV